MRMSHGTRQTFSRRARQGDEMRMSHGTHMKDSWHLCRVAYGTESCHTYEWVMSHGTDAQDRGMRCGWVMSHMTESRHTFPRVWKSCITHMNQSYHTYEWVTSHGTDTRDRTRRGWVTSHVWMRHVTHMNESFHTNEWMNHESCHRCARPGDEMRMSHGNRWTISSLRTPTLWNSSKGMYIYWRLELLHAYTIIRRCYQLWDAMGSIHFHMCIFIRGYWRIYIFNMPIFRMGYRPREMHGKKNIGDSMETHTIHYDAHEQQIWGSMGSHHVYVFHGGFTWNLINCFHKYNMYFSDVCLYICICIYMHMNFRIFAHGCNDIQW